MSLHSLHGSVLAGNNKALLLNEDDDEPYVTALGRQHNTSNTVAYESIGPLQLERAIKDQVDFISKSIWVHADLALVLLLHHRWDTDKLVEANLASRPALLESVGAQQGEGEPAELASFESAIAAVDYDSRARNSGNSLKRSASPGPSSSYPHKRPHLGSSSSSSSSAAFVAAATVTMPSSHADATPLPQQQISCGVCYDPIPPPSASTFLGSKTSTAAATVRCGHQFCSSCRMSYLASEIRDSGKLVLRCMAYKCATVLFETFIRRFASSVVYKRWRTLLVQSFVTAQSSLRFCPGPSCDQALSLSLCSSSNPLHPKPAPSPSPTVTCTHSHLICFACGHPGGHAPIPCALARFWLLTVEDDRRRRAAEDARWGREREEMWANELWKATHAKCCPTCGVPIEKSTGCNHMHCSRCSNDFCYGCGKLRHKNGSSTCNGFGGRTSKQQMQAQAREVVARLVQRREEEREKAREDPLGAEPERVRKVVEDVRVRVAAALGVGIEDKDMQTAVTELMHCCVTLKWTESMDYLMSPGDKKTKFVSVNSGLKASVEGLSQLLKLITKDRNSTRTRRNVLLKETSILKRRHQALLSDASRGFVENIWEWEVDFTGYGS